LSVLLLLFISSSPNTNPASSRLIIRTGRLIKRTSPASHICSSS
jgi:hypothetical protein